MSLSPIILQCSYRRFRFNFATFPPLFFTSIMRNSGKEAAGRSLSTGTLLQNSIKLFNLQSLCTWFSFRAALWFRILAYLEIERKQNTLFRIRRCPMLIAEPVGQSRRLHWRSASQLHHRSTCANSTAIYCIDRSKRPIFYCPFAGPWASFYSLFVALAVLALIRPCSACEIVTYVDLPQSSYSFSSCFGGCTTAGNTHV